MKKRNNYIFSFWFFSILYILITVNFPTSIFTYLIHDDEYFIDCAKNIVSGEWLGPYSQMRLIKGPGYSLFLAATHISGLPVSLTMAMLHIGSCIISTIILRKLGLSPLWSLFLYLILLFQPAIFPERILRDYVNNSLSIISISGIIYIFTYNIKYWKVFFFGLSFGFFMITREDPHWLLCSIAVIMVLNLIKLNKYNIYISIAIYISASFIPYTIVSGINKYIYGKFIVCDFRDKSFRRALNSLYTISTKREIRHIPVTREKMEIAFSISPTFKQLEPYFKEKEKMWTDIAKKLYNYGEGEYFSWFMWAFRDAAADAGYYKSINDASNFYDKIAEEIETACENNLISCRSPLIDFIPNMPNTALKEIPYTLYDFIKKYIYIYPFPENFYSEGDKERIASTIDFLNITKYQPTNKMQISGWYYSTVFDWFTIICPDKTFKPRKLFSPDIAMNFKNNRASFSRFDFFLENPKDCTIILDDNVKYLFNALEIRDFTSNNIFFRLDKKIQSDNDFGWAFYFVQSMCIIFRYINCILFIFGSFSICYITLFSLKKRILPRNLFNCYGLWCAFYMRLGILILVAISLFPTVHVPYMLPLWPFMSMASILSIHTCLETITNKKQE